MTRPESPEFGTQYVFGDDAEHASKWETQELTRYWRNAIGSLDELIATAEKVRAELITQGLHGAYVQFLVGGNALSRKAIDAERSLTQLQGVENGLVHRLALERHAAEDAALDATPGIIADG